jgi:hypothetical protein
MNRIVLALFCLLPAALFAADDPPKPHVRLKFDGNDKNEGTGKAKVTLKNTTFKDKALVVNGIYPFGEKDPEKASDVQIATPKMSYDAFSVAVRFKADEFGDRGNPVIVGGPDYRWFHVGANGAGNLSVRLNGGDQVFEAKDTKLPTGKWVVVACSVSVKDKKVIVFVDGKKADEFALPDGFAFSVATSDAKDRDKLWTTINYSNSGTFKGQIDEFIIYDTALSAEQLAKVPLKP